MLTPERRQRAGRVVRSLIALLALVLLGAVGAYFYATRSRFAPDANLVAELSGATLADLPASERLPGEWPQWRGPRRDGASGETGLLGDWPADGPKVLWKQECGEGYSSLAVADGRAYSLEQTDGGEAVVCRAADTGQEAWRYDYECPTVTDQGPGPRSTPTVAGGRVYAVGATGIFHCLDAATGKKEWRHDLLDEYGARNLQWGASFSPLVEGDLVVTNPGGPNGASVVAFDRTTGKEAWRSQDDPAGYSSPIAVGAGGARQIVVFTGTSLIGLSPKDGALFWRFPWKTDHQVNAATPVAFGAPSGDYLFISSGYNKGCALLKVVAGSGGKPEVRLVYEGNQMCCHFASPVRHGDCLYGFNDAALTCMDLRTGKVSWSHKGFGKGSLLVADGNLIVLGDGGELALAEATPDAYREKARARVARGRCWAVPVLAGGRLYVREQARITCLDLRPAGK